MQNAADQVFYVLVIPHYLSFVNNKFAFFDNILFFAINYIDKIFLVIYNYLKSCTGEKSENNVHLGRTSAFSGPNLFCFSSASWQKKNKTNSKKRWS